MRLFLPSMPRIPCAAHPCFASLNGRAGIIEIKILVISFFVTRRRNVGEKESKYPNKVHGVGVPGTE